MSEERASDYLQAIAQGLALVERSNHTAATLLATAASVAGEIALNRKTRDYARINAVAHLIRIAELMQINPKLSDQKAE
jgi:hypothetical protein